MKKNWKVNFLYKLTINIYNIFNFSKILSKMHFLHDRNLRIKDYIFYIILYKELRSSIYT